MGRGLALVIAMAVVLLAAVTGPRAGEGGEVFIPSFIDPAGVAEGTSLEPGTTIRFVTVDDYPPFDFIGPDGALAGFNVDLARALCEALKATCTIQVRAWADLIPALLRNQADAVIASQAITPEARHFMAFTHPVYRTPARFVTRLGAAAPASPVHAGSRVGVQAGTAQEAYLRTFFPSVVVVPFPSIASARAALKEGAVDSLFDDGVGAAIWLNGAADGCCAFSGGPYTETHFFGEGAGIALRKGDATLRRALDAALAGVTASGRFGDLYLKYFPVGFY